MGKIGAENNIVMIDYDDRYFLASFNGASGFCMNTFNEGTKDIIPNHIPTLLIILQQTSDLVPLQDLKQIIEPRKLLLHHRLARLLLRVVASRAKSWHRGTRPW